MNVSILKKLMEYPLDAQLKFNISDAIINVLIKEKLVVSLISSVEVKSCADFLQIQIIVGIKPLTKTITIELEYGGFHCTKNDGILSFRIRNSNIKFLLKIIGNVIPSNIIFLDEYLKIDIHKAFRNDNQYLVKSILRQSQINECKFLPGIICLDIILVNGS
ncbi:MAG: hypothetical protein K9N06_04395 [Candidatus Cloacimonetes bacterium]|nr:hypothetical protein [Candidatus Cloacimonadota bacterium]